MDSTPDRRRRAVGRGTVRASGGMVTDCPRPHNVAAGHGGGAERGRDREELANALTHGAGVLLSLVGAVVLAYRAAWHGSAAHSAAVGVYGASLVGAFAASTLYHAASATGATRTPRLKNALLWLDHSCIYALIAGTYTPFLVSVLKGAAGTALLWGVWGLAAAGVVAGALPGFRSGLVSVALCLLMGWMVVVVLQPLAAELGPGGTALLVAGGLSYSLGVAFYLVGRAYFHAVWHGFVLAGGALHYACVLLYAVPR